MVQDGYCQEAQLRRIPITITLFSQGVAVPFTKFLPRPVHPGVMIGTEFNYKPPTSFRWFQSLNAGYYFHHHFAQGIFLNTEMGYEYRTKSGPSAAILVGGGYLHVFRTQPEYSLVNGQYQREADKGNGRFMPTLTIDAGHYLSKHPQASRIFVRYQTWVQCPFSPGFIPLLSHTNLHVAYKFYPNKRR